MSVITEDTVTTFYFKIDSLTDRVQMEVIYKVRKRDEILGLGDNSIIDVELLIKEYMSSVSHEIFSKWISPLGRDLEDLDDPQEAFEFDETFTHPETKAETENCIIYRVILPDNFNNSLKKPIFRAIEDMIVGYCVWQWLMDSNLQGWEKYELEYLRKETRLTGLMSNRVGVTKRPYTEF